MADKGEAASFRAYYTEVPEKIRQEIYLDILSCDVAGDADVFERLTVKVLAYTAAGRLTPSMSKACHDLLALISHSLVARKTNTTTATLTATVSQTLSEASRLEKAVKKKLPDYGEKAVKKKLPDYGNLDNFISQSNPEPAVIDAEPVKLKRGTP
jgi:hypothetical protein